MDECPQMKAKLAGTTTRDPAGGKKVLGIENDLMVGIAEDMGGGGAFAAPGDFMKILKSLLQNDGKLLQPKTVDEMFTTQLNETCQDALMKEMRIPAVNQMLGAFPPDCKKNWGFGGLIVEEDIDHSLH
ncbi:hypothetical protein MMC25_005045 [Agyrium rufum]|nr:hypothetical protein [Agyrium rufum]